MSLLWNTTAVTIYGIIVTTGVSFVVGDHYYGKGKSDVLEDAIEEAKRRGQEIGVREGREAFDADRPNLIVVACGEEIERAENLGRAEGLAQGRQEGLAEGRTQGQAEGFAEGQKHGHTQGWEQGHAEGFATGVQQTRDNTIQEYTLQRHAERNWDNYAKVAASLAAMADMLEAEPGQRELEAELVSNAEALVEAARTLQAAYADQADAFNSIVVDLAEALAARNFPAIRVHARALRNNLGLKGELFLQANQNVVTAFESLGN